MSPLPRLLVVVPLGTEPRLSAGNGFDVVREEDLVRCHSDQEVRAAAGSAYVTISPVAPTDSKPGYGPPLGVTGVRSAVGAAGPMPVFALGGVTLADVAAYREAGAYGVAVMGPVLRADDPAAVVRDYLAALR